MPRASSRSRWMTVEDGMVVFIPGTATFIDLDDRGRCLFDALTRHHWDAERARRDVATSIEPDEPDAARTLQDLVQLLDRHGFFDDTP